MLVPRYELTGGYIKNALVSALLSAISRDSVNPLVTEEDVVSGCQLQMRGSLQACSDFVSSHSSGMQDFWLICVKLTTLIYLTLQCNFVMQMKSFTHRVVPKISMEELILSSALRERLDAVINFEKARAVLLGQWGFEQERLGTACLFWGPHGTGKSAAAEVPVPPLYSSFKSCFSCAFVTSEFGDCSYGGLMLHCC